MRDPQTPDAQNPREIGRLRRRADFLRVGGGKRWHAAGMTVQTAQVPAGEAPAEEAPAGEGVDGVRVGFTLTRKVGGAVVRNRIRRRLKAAVRLAADLPARAGHDYVIVGRIEALRMPFAALQRELGRAVRAVHDAGRNRPRAKRKEPSGTP